MNIAVFLYSAVVFTTDMSLSRFYFDYAMIPARMSEGQGYAGLLTSMFLHAGIMHIAGNMLFLWIFGDNLEDKMGHFGFLAFYILSGVGAGFAQLAVDPTSPVPMVGASGAIAGVLGGYLLLFPKAKVDIFIFFVIFFRILPIPAWIMLGLWFALQLTNAFANDISGGGVAYWAHAGGFIVGFVFAIPLWHKLGGRQWWLSTDYHPAHPEAEYPSRIPIVRKR